MCEQITIRVAGMTCFGCEQRAATVVMRLAGVSTATADHRTGIVSAQIDSQKVSRDEVAERLAVAGFAPLGTS